MTTKSGKPRIYRRWEPILEHARDIVESYDTDVSLRQLFYRLVSDETLRNTQGDYNQLSKRTAEARRDGGFPDLVDSTRQLDRMASWGSVEAALEQAASDFRLDHGAEQPYGVYVVVEKAALSTQLWSWFGHLGIGIAALRGYHSVPLEEKIVDDIERRDHLAAICLYVGDFDPSGKDIERNFEHHVGHHFEEVRRVALTWEQVEEYGLPPQMGKSTDTRAAAFAQEHGQLVQVEADALPPDTLRRLLTDAVDEFYDHDLYKSILELEAREQERGERLVSRLSEEGKDV